MVKPQDLGHIIDEHPFFQGLNAPLREALVCCAANERFVAGEHLFREGAEARKFYLIRQGQVAIEVEAPVRKPIILETLSDGEVLGWSWLVPPHRTAFTARAQTTVRVLSFDTTCLLKKMEADPALGFAVLRRFVPIMAHRLSAARLQLLDLYGPAMAAAPKAEKKPKTEKAVKASKGRNRSAVAALEGVRAEAQADKAALKLAKAKGEKPAKKKAKSS
ncbi:MAG TPA: cyclic nucleotide-binding domain-containing protein [Magnetospirillum sp.]|nr:cyclic nucleotide-binding domain-containing protein [Magnetospirillum sp.]